MKVSVIVSFYERIQHLRYCLRSIEENECVDEVIIADDGSSEDAVSEIHSLTQKISLNLHHVWQKKEGFRLASSRNNAIRKSTGDYLIFFDCDFYMLKNCVSAHLSLAQKGYFVGALCKYSSKSFANSAFTKTLDQKAFISEYNSITNKTISREHYKFLKCSFFRKIGYLPHRKIRCSSHFSIHREDILKVNGYDEQFKGWGGEDEDLAIRMSMAGLRGKSAIKKAQVLHIWHPKELGGLDWSYGKNVNYLKREKIKPFCEAGLDHTHSS